jgi:hypothetical protein
MATASASSASDSPRWRTRMSPTRVSKRIGLDSLFLEPPGIHAVPVARATAHIEVNGHDLRISTLISRPLFWRTPSYAAGARNAQWGSPRRFLVPSPEPPRYLIENRERSLQFLRRIRTRPSRFRNFAFESPCTVGDTDEGDDRSVGGKLWSGCKCSHG